MIPEATVRCFVDEVERDFRGARGVVVIAEVEAAAFCKGGAEWWVAERDVIFGRPGVGRETAMLSGVELIEHSEGFGHVAVGPDFGSVDGLVWLSRRDIC